MESDLHCSIRAGGALLAQKSIALCNINTVAVILFSPCGNHLAAIVKRQRLSIYGAPWHT